MSPAKRKARAPKPDPIFAAIDAHAPAVKVAKSLSRTFPAA
jgi:hypothetical protein